MIRQVLITLSCIALIAGIASGDEKKKPAAQDPMAAMAKYSTAGAQHKMLRTLVGTWSCAGTWWLAPGKPPLQTTTSAEFKPIGDLWVVEDASGNFMGQPFMGHGVYGYDIAKSKYVSTWVDSMGSFIVNAEGSADATGKVISYEMNDFDPMTAKQNTMRQSMKFDSNDKHTVTMFKVGPDGKAAKIAELVYTRK
jgi:Protein of unknown function (DUF1579)